MWGPNGDADSLSSVVVIVPGDNAGLSRVCVVNGRAGGRAVGETYQV